MNEESKAVLTVAGASITPPPNGSDLREQLTEKLAEYITRLAGVDRQWKGLEPRNAFRRFHMFRVTCHKVEILGEVLASNEPIGKQSLLQNAKQRHGKAFVEEAFQVAFGIIAVYCGDTPEVPIHGGTGLPVLDKV